MRLELSRFQGICVFIATASQNCLLAVAARSLQATVPLACPKKKEGVCMSQRLYKILSQQEWLQVLEAQALVGFGIDLADGFIHLSSAE